jgi:hypothetical protein
VSAVPDTAHCIQDYLEDHFGGAVGRLSGLAYEVRQDAAVTHLIGRSALAPSHVVFALSLTPAGSNEVEAHLRMIAYRFAGTKPAVIEGIDACVRPGS